MLQKKRQIVKKGDILSIPLKEGKIMYLARVEEGEVIFKLTSNTVETNIDNIINSGVLFFTGIYDDVLRSKDWMKIGKYTNQGLPVLEPKFIFDNIGNKFEKYENGMIDGLLSFDDIYNLEMVLAYDKHHIENILEYYIETGFYHPRVWDGFNSAFWKGGIKLDKCINGEYDLKEEHIQHAKVIYNKYFLAVIEGKENELFY